jgi:predicted cation transporter
MEKNYEDQPDNSFFDDNKKTSFISFYCNKHFSYVILCWIIEILYRILFKCFSDYFSITKDIIINYYSIIILSSIADLLSVFIYLYVKFRSKSNRDEKIKKDEKKLNKLNRKSFRIKLIIICGLEYLGHSFH